MASKLIVNEIEHTDGAGTAVTMAKATITDATLTSATATLTAGTLGSGVIFPAGHQVRQSVIHKQNQASSITFDTNSYEDSGLEISHVTAYSSADSYLIYEFYHGMANTNASATHGYIDTTMTTTSNYTHTGGTSTSAETIASTGSYPTFLYATSGGDLYWTVFLRYYVGLETGFAMPSTKSSWNAGDTLYFRIFCKKGGSGDFVLYGGTDYNMTVTEVMR